MLPSHLLSAKSSDVLRKSLQKLFPQARNPVTKDLFQSSSAGSCWDLSSFPPLLPWTFFFFFFSWENKHFPSLRCVLSIRSCTFVTPLSLQGLLLALGLKVLHSGPAAASPRAWSVDGHDFGECCPSSGCFWDPCTALPLPSSAGVNGFLLMQLF